jgi:hypothetical protein
LKKEQPALALPEQAAPMLCLRSNNQPFMITA